MASVDKQRQHAEQLLYSMIPKPTAIRLKNGEDPINTWEVGPQRSPVDFDRSSFSFCAVTVRRTAHTLLKYCRLGFCCCRSPALGQPVTARDFVVVFVTSYVACKYACLLFPTLTF